MFNYTLLVENDEGAEVTRYQLDTGASRKGAALRQALCQRGGTTQVS